MSEVNQAAERLRRAQHEPVYEGPRFIFSRLPLTVSDPRQAMDIAIAVDTFIAEHAADDDEPITEEWWDTLNEKYAVDTDNEIVIGRYFVGLDYTQVFMQTVSDYIALPHINTRGQLRKLLEALQ